MSQWPNVSLGEAVTFLDSRRRPVKANDRVAGPYPYYGANGQQGTINGFLFDEPLVLLAEDGGHFDEPQRGIAYLISGKTWVNNHAHVLRANNGFIPDFIEYQLKHRDIRAYITGTTRGKLTKSDASRILISRPPLEEQRRIVDILDRAASIRRLRRQAQDTARQIVPALFNKMFGDPMTNPMGWPLLPLADIVRPISGATPSKAVPHFWTGEIPWVSAKDLKSDPIVSSMDAITSDARVAARLHLVPIRTVLILVRGMTLMHTVPIRLTAVPLTINQDVKALVPRRELNGTWLRWCLQCLHPVILSLVSSAAHGTRKLDLDRLMSVKLPIVPISLQNLFEQRATALSRLAGRSQVAEAAAHAATKSIQYRLFGG